MFDNNFKGIDEWSKEYTETKQMYEPLWVLAHQWAFESNLGADYTAKQIYAFTSTKPVYSLEDLEAAFDEIKNDYLKTANRDFSKEPGYFRIGMVTREY
jgi:hypothetical protein